MLLSHIPAFLMYDLPMSQNFFSQIHNKVFPGDYKTQI